MPENDPYKDVPHHGQHFTENGETFYWNFSNVEPGTRITEKNTAWRATGPPIVKMEPELSDHPMFPSAAPVYQGSIHNPGFFYEIDVDVTAIENSDTPSGRITKWRDNRPLSGAEQTLLAWDSSSVEDYKAKKLANWPPDPHRPAGRRKPGNPSPPRQST